METIEIYNKRASEIFTKWFVFFHGEENLKTRLDKFISNGGYDDEFQLQEENDTWAGDLTGIDVKTRENSGNNPDNPMLDSFLFNDKRIFLVAQL
jgi:hypothetical protein